MSKKVTKKQPSDDSILFSEVKINGIVVKPWSFGMLFELSRAIEKIMDRAEEKGLINALDREFTTGVLSYVTIAKLFTIASDDVLDIISKTISMEMEKVRELDISTGIKIVSTIYRQNASIIKNELSLLLPQAEKQMEEEEGRQEVKEV